MITMSLSVAIQLSVSVLLAWKIWRTSRSAKGVGTRRVASQSVGWIILESGAVLSICTSGLLATYAEKLVLAAILMTIVAQMDVSAHAMG